MNKKMGGTFIRLLCLWVAYGPTRLFKETYQQISVVRDYTLTTMLTYSKSSLFFSFMFLSSRDVNTLS